MSKEIPRRSFLAAAGTLLVLGVEACGSGDNVTDIDIFNQMQAWKPTLTEIQQAHPQNVEIQAVGEKEIFSINNHHGKKMSYAFKNGELVLLTYSYKEHPDNMFDDYALTIEKGATSWAIEIVNSPHNKSNNTWTRKVYSTAPNKDHLSKSGFKDVAKKGNIFLGSLR